MSQVSCQLTPQAVFNQKEALDVLYQLQTNCGKSVSLFPRKHVKKGEFALLAHSSTMGLRRRRCARSSSSHMLTLGILAGLRGKAHRLVGASFATFTHSSSLRSNEHVLLSTTSGDYGPGGPGDDVEIIADGIIMGTKIDYNRDFFGGPNADVLLGVNDEALDEANEDISTVGADDDSDADAILVGGEDAVESDTVTLDGGDLVITSGEQQMPSSSSTGNIQKLQRQLKEELREYRMKQSKPIGKPPYSVFTNAAMEEICETLPTTNAELLDVKGIGNKKLEMFGDDILSIVSKYASNSELMEAREKAKSKIKAKLPPRVSPIDPKSLSEEQRRAAEVPLEKKSNAFITGAAGTGKSYVLKYLIQEMHNRGIRYGIAAPTGVAAVNVGGSTLHSFFGIGLGIGSIPTLIKKVKKNKEAVRRIDETDVLCIDEV